MTAVGDETAKTGADRQFRRKYALTDVLRTSAGLEYSVHSCPRQYKQDMDSLFPGQDVSKFLIVPTQQKARVDLVNTGEEVEKEKDRLLETFAVFASGLVDRLSHQGHFADYIDPCSGLPMVNRNSQTYYGEVEAAQTLLGYPVANAGCCKVLLHPAWGSAVYPATFFTSAPLEVLLDALKHVDQPVAQM
ncbi:hypothetical protein CLOM_g22026 [Closterium sp. NIES-68]|nr:hypothetical protein CLOM_g22026 [Closterium sp. NIES-68]GJP77793.1 hypothetical protein CLOP_g8137 [Closterium sp. NIES-67]